MSGKFHDFDAECAVLGSALLFPETACVVAGDLSEEHFTTQKTRLIHKAITALQNEGHDADSPTVCNWLSAQDYLQDVGRRFVVELTGASSSREPDYQIGRLKRLLLARKAVREYERALARINDDPEGVEDAIEQTASFLIEKTALVDKEEPELIGDIVLRRYKALEERMLKGEPDGLPTTYKDLDNLIRLCPDELIVLGARPAMGKTSLALQIGYRIATYHDKHVAFFSLEMSKDKLADRLMAAVAGVDGAAIRTGRCPESEVARLSRALDPISGSKLFIDDSWVSSVPHLAAKCRRIQARKGLDLVIVDYLQLIESKRRAGNRTEEVSEISRGLKMLAKSLGVPVLALSQLSRTLESRQDKRPQLSDLRESGSIEQDADIVVFVYRDEYYDDESEDRGVAELLVRKNRNGETGTVKVGFAGTTTCFYDLKTYTTQGENNS